MTRLVAWAGLVVLVGFPGAARAYQDPASYGLVTLEGGGDGRYFTGSPRDRYTCAVCHYGEEAPLDAELSGLPEEGYLPGQTYAITLTLPAATLASAGVLEITDAEGAAAGTLALPEPAPEDLCGDGVTVAAQLVQPQLDRQVAITDTCEAARLRVSWQAPDTPSGPVTVYAVAVSADTIADVWADDHARVLERPVPMVGEPIEGPRVGSACAVSARPSGHLSLAVALIAAAWAIRRRLG